MSYNYSVFPNSSTQTLTDNEYYHTFYQVSQENPNVMTSYTYDNNKNLIETIDVSFGDYSISEALTILNQNGANPYGVGKTHSGTTHIPMSVAYFDIYNRFLTTSQHKGVMTKVNKIVLSRPPTLIGTITGSGVLHDIVDHNPGNATNGVEIQIVIGTFPAFFDEDYHPEGYYRSNKSLDYVVNVVVTHPTNTGDTYNFTAFVEGWTNGSYHFIRCHNCTTESPQGDSTSVVSLYDATL